MTACCVGRIARVRTIAKPDQRKNPVLPLPPPTPISIWHDGRRFPAPRQGTRNQLGQDQNRNVQPASSPEPMGANERWRSAGVSRAARVPAGARFLDGPGRLPCARRRHPRRPPLQSTDGRRRQGLVDRPEAPSAVGDGLRVNCKSPCPRLVRRIRSALRRFPTIGDETGMR